MYELRQFLISRSTGCARIKLDVRAVFGFAAGSPCDLHIPAARAAATPSSPQRSVQIRTHCLRQNRAHTSAHTTRGPAAVATFEVS